MLKRLVSDALGLSDIGSVISPADYDKVDADDYVMHEDGEKIIFLIKSKTDEYCFTNLALIHVDGTSAVSKKRTLRRFDYNKHPIQNVALESVLKTGLDIEIKFSMGELSYSIDVNKKYIEELKDLYKALIKIGTLQYENAERFQQAQQSLVTAANAVNRSTSAVSLEEQFKAVNQYAFDWMQQARESYVRKDFGAVFEKFIKN